MPIGPHAAVADIHQDGSGGTIYLSAQSINGIPAQIQPVLAGLANSKWVNTPAANYRIVWYEGASSFGGGIAGTGGHEPGEQAAVISAVIGKPVRVQWMRWDQHGWDHYGVANMFDVTMGADATGKITAAQLAVLRSGPEQHRRNEARARPDHLAGGSGCRRARSAGRR